MSYAEITAGEQKRKLREQAKQLREHNKKLKAKDRKQKAQRKKLNKRLDATRDVLQDSLFGGVKITRQTKRGYVPNAVYRNRRRRIRRRQLA